MSKKNEREDHRLAGEVSVAEARESLGRFVRSHFHNHDYGLERARFSIPADPRRDDDIRLGAFISRAEKALAAIARVTEVLDDNGCDCKCWHRHEVHHLEDHNDDCDRCLACRIKRAIEGDAA